MTINQAYTEIDRFFADKKQRDAYEARERQYRDYISDMADAREDGILEGRAKERIDLARKLLLRGDDPASVSELTQLSPDLVRSLRQTE